MNKDYYQILGLEPNASQEEIKRAYRLYASKFHPDKHKGDKFFEEQFLLIREAYEVLSDPQKRIKFDRNFSKNASKQQKTNFDKKRNEDRSSSKHKKPDKKPERNIGTLFNWFIIGAGLIALSLIIINYSENLETDTSEINSLSTVSTVKPGLYIGLFSGHKQGGPQRHSWLVNFLEESLIFRHFNISCIQGLDKTQNSSIEINDYRQRNPRFKITENCEESSEVFIGPFHNRESMHNFFNYNEMQNIDLHLYETFYECNYSCEEITY